MAVSIHIPSVQLSSVCDYRWALPVQPLERFRLSAACKNETRSGFNLTDSSIFCVAGDRWPSNFKRWTASRFINISSMIYEVNEKCDSEQVTISRYFNVGQRFRRGASLFSLFLSLYFCVLWHLSIDDDERTCFVSSTGRPLTNHLHCLQRTQKFGTKNFRFLLSFFYLILIFFFFFSFFFPNLLFCFMTGQRKERRS